MHGQLINSCLSCFIFFVHNKFFSILRLLGNILLDFIRRVCSSFPNIHTSLFHLFEPDQPIDSPVVAVIVGTRTPDRSHKEQYPNFSLLYVFTSTSASASYDLCWANFLLAWPNQLSVQVFYGYFGLSFNVGTTFWSRSLFSFDTYSKRLETTVSRSMSAQVSLLHVRLATEFVIRPVSSGWSLMNPVPTRWELCLLPCAGCCLKLRNVEVNWGHRQRRLSASYPCWKPVFLVGRLIDVCSLLTSMQNLGS